MRKMFHTPEGVRDVYGTECERKLYLQNKLQKIFHVYGYQDIETPTFEYFDVFSQKIGTTPSKDLYKFFDREGNTLVLRPDFTPSIARAASRYFNPEYFPIRLCYRGNTFVNNSSYQGRMKESTQMGVELIGDASVDADAEIIALVIHVLKETGLTDFQISIGQIDFYRSLVQEAGLSEDLSATLQELISNKNYFGVEELVRGENLPENMVKIFTMMPQLCGSLDVIASVRSLTENPQALAALARLEELYYVLTQYGCERYVSIDLGMLSTYQYYTGIIFQGYTYGTGEALVKGGRYNHLLEHFGNPNPSIGFCLVMEQVINALERQNIDVNIYKGRTLLVYDEKARNLAIRMSIAHRERYMEIQCMRMEGGKTVEDYIPYGKHHQFVELVYPVSAQEIQVYNLFTDEKVQTDWDGFR